MNNLININLYGDGSRNAKLRAEAIYCDRCEECSLYKRGLCCKLTAFLLPTCPIGTKNAYGHCTKQAKAYDKLYKETQAKPEYHKLKYPLDMCLETVGEDILLNLNFTCTSYKDNVFKIENPTFCNNIICMPKEVLTNDVLKNICEFIPRTMFDRAEIKDYQNKVVPNFINDLRTKLPDIYKRFISEYPQFDITPNYVGKRAKLSTVNTTLTYHLKNYGDFHFEIPDYYKLYVVFDNYNSAFLPFKAKNTKLQFEVTDDMTIEITDNNQVTEWTIFV